MRSNLEQVRQQKLANFCQVILLDSKGNVMESCNSIFDASAFGKKPAYEWFPFIESVFPSLAFLKLGAPALLFSKVENPSDLLPGLYDFSFSKIKIDHKEYILWELFDYTTLYRDYRLYQQKRNELEIQRQRFALENKGVKSKGEISKRSLDFKEEGSHKKSTSFNKKVVTPLSALDMAVNTMKFMPPSQEEVAYLNSIDSIAVHLKRIVEELPEQEVDLSVNQSGLERDFSPENLLYDALPYISSENIHVMEASISEELPNRVFGNPLDFKRIIAGLAQNVVKCYINCSLTVSLYLHDQTQDKCVIGIQILATDGEEIEPDMMDVLMRLAIIKRIVELHQGKIEMETSSRFGAKTVCLLPFLLC